MKAIQFCYWLQGTFEILEVKNFNEDEVLLIKKNLDQVFKNDPNGNYPFCNWLQGFFELVKPTEINTIQTNIIKKKLYNVFNHVIEKKTKGIVDDTHSIQINC